MDADEDLYVEEFEAPLLQFFQEICGIWFMMNLKRIDF